MTNGLGVFYKRSSQHSSLFRSTVGKSKLDIGLYTCTYIKYWVTDQQIIGRWELKDSCGWLCYNSWFCFYTYSWVCCTNTETLRWRRDRRHIKPRTKLMGPSRPLHKKHFLHWTKLMTIRSCKWVHHRTQNNDLTTLYNITYTSLVLKCDRICSRTRVVYGITLIIYTHIFYIISKWYYIYIFML